GARRGLDVDAHLAGHERSERRLPEPGRPVEQHMVERLAPALRRLDGDGERLPHLVLADELGQPLGAKARLDALVVLEGFRRGDFGSIAHARNLRCPGAPVDGGRAAAPTSTDPWEAARAPARPGSLRAAGRGYTAWPASPLLRAPRPAPAYRGSGPKPP